MFVRESEGVYRFGSRKVHVKIEKGNQIYVRVGGGYVHIDEFIELYTPKEVGLIEKKMNILQRFHNRLTMPRASHSHSCSGS